MYLFASLDQRNICKFSLCCVFQLVHQSLRNIVIIIFFISFQSNHRTLIASLSFIVIVIADLQISTSNAFGLPLDHFNCSSKH